MRSGGTAFVAATPAKTVRADANGNFTTTITLDTVCVNTITATGGASGPTATVQVTVMGETTTSSGIAVLTTQAANNGGGGGLSYTGTNRSMIVFGSIGGLLAIIIGAGLPWLGFSRRPRRRHSA